MERILLLGPTPSGKGGVRVWVGMVLRYIKEHPGLVEVDLLDTSRSVSLSHLLPTYKRVFFAVSDYLGVLLRFGKCLKGMKYDIVHISSSGGEGILRDWLFVAIARLFKVRCIVHYHCGTIPMTLKRNGILSRLLKNIARNSDIIVLDQASYEALRQITSGKVYKIGNAYNAIIDSLYDNYFKRDPNYILFVGHLVYQKGVRELISALHDIPNIHLACYGVENESVKDELLRYISQNGFKGRVDFMGLRSPETIYSEMCKAGMFVLPTYTEGFPFVIVEAMAAGCPIISTPVGAIEEMLSYNGELQGYLVQPGNADELKSVIEKCLESYKDMIVKAESAREKAKNIYSTDAIMEQLLTLWKKSLL